MSMLTALKDNWSMALTADIPKVSRVAGVGIVKLAQVSGRPIYPVAVATSGGIGSAGVLATMRAWAAKAGSWCRSRSCRLPPSSQLRDHPPTW